ncbi:MAG: pyridoxamine 5'-phosphate oxidase family protein [Deltaproteobacteria bacterium]|nr:MAG: pyridoxamine 5'-phosphate oxidase family protein [Deltaproteobacteria bacterium]
MDATLKGPWSLEQVRRHLDETRIPIRLSCQNPSGFPLLVSLWYLHRDDALWCATRRDAAIARFLRRDARCGFEVARDAPPYRGVRGVGHAQLVEARGEEILRALVDRYLGSEDVPLARWLLARADREVAIRIEPARIVSWDYSERMQGIR